MEDNNLDNQNQVPIVPSTQDKEDFPKPKQSKFKPIHLLVPVLCIAIAGFLLFLLHPEYIHNVFQKHESPILEDGTLAPLSVEDVTSAATSAIAVDHSDLCKQNTIKTFGTVNDKKDLIVYGTVCAYKMYDNHGLDSVARFYVRDSEGTFNKLIYSDIANQYSFGNINAEIIDQKKKQVKISKGGMDDNDYVVVDLNGNIVLDGHKGQIIPSNILRNESKKLISPDQKLEATSYYSDSDQGNLITIKNITTGKTKDYKVGEKGLDGISADSWSLDSKILYVQGGVWEFGAPAVLYSLDISSGLLTEYKNLDKYRWPIKVYPEYNVGYLPSDNSGDYMDNNDKLTSLSLSAMALNPISKPLPLISETGVTGFDNVERIDNNLFYSIDLSATEHAVKKFDLTTNEKITIASGDANLLEGDANEKWITIIDKGIFKVYFFNGKYDVIGQQDISDPNTKTADSKEYVHQFVGILKN